MGDFKEKSYFIHRRQSIWEHFRNTVILRFVLRTKCFKQIKFGKKSLFKKSFLWYTFVNFRSWDDL